jgi:SAM-dependent methyltransferase
MCCTHVLGLRSLHWGVWKEGEPVTLNGLRTAQERYTEKLLAAIPDGVRTILDVGCGMGDNAVALAGNGYHVTCIAPIANYADHLSSMHERGISFVQTRIETFESDTLFDMVLMSESTGYFTPEVAFGKSWRLLKPGGHLLVCNMFRREPVSLKVAAHTLDDYLRQAETSGFRVVFEEDITQSTLPSLRLAMSLWESHAVPALALGAFYLRSASWRTRLAFRLGKLFFSHQVGKVENSLRAYREQLDPDLVGRYVSYKLFVFRKDEAPRAGTIPATG